LSCGGCRAECPFCGPSGCRRRLCIWRGRQVAGAWQWGLTAARCAWCAHADSADKASRRADLVLQRSLAGVRASLVVREEFSACVVIRPWTCRKVRRRLVLTGSSRPTVREPRTPYRQALPMLVGTRTVTGLRGPARPQEGGSTPVGGLLSPTVGFSCASRASPRDPHCLC
jgi:hypothetical protein